MPEEQDNILGRFQELENWEKLDFSDPTKLFGGGSCYVYDSLPFTYAWFLKNPTLDGMFDCISAGGDADSNGSMFGAMLGAREGMSVFPDYLITGLQNSQEVLSLADEFCNKLGIKE